MTSAFAVGAAAPWLEVPVWLGELGCLDGLGGLDGVGCLDWLGGLVLLACPGGVDVRDALDGPGGPPGLDGLA